MKHRHPQRLLPLTLLLMLWACAPQPRAASAPTPQAARPTPTHTLAPTAATPTPTPIIAPTETAPPTPMLEPRVTLAAVGDMMLARSLGQALSANPADSPFVAVREQLRAADITVGNLECAVGTTGEPQPKAYTFRAPPEAAPALADAGFDLLSLANNHILDYGVAAMDQTIQLLDAQGLLHAGAGSNAAVAHQAVIAEVGGLRLAFLAYANVPVERGGFVTEGWTAGADAPGLAWAVPEQVAADVSAAAPQADHVIVLLHSGYEGSEQPNDIQRANAYAAIDAGATLVIGAHPHVLQGVERYKGGLIAYSLGNFVFDGFDGAGAESAILTLTLTRAGVEGYRWTPVVLREGRPQLAEGAQAEAILARLARLSDQ